MTYIPPKGSTGEIGYISGDKVFGDSSFSFDSTKKALSVGSGNSFSNAGVNGIFVGTSMTDSTNTYGGNNLGAGTGITFQTSANSNFASGSGWVVSGDRNGLFGTSSSTTITGDDCLIAGQTSGAGYYATTISSNKSVIAGIMDNNISGDGCGIFGNSHACSRDYIFLSGTNNAATAGNNSGAVGTTNTILNSNTFLTGQFSKSVLDDSFGISSSLSSLMNVGQRYSSVRNATTVGATTVNAFDGANNRILLVGNGVFNYATSYFKAMAVGQVDGATGRVCYTIEGCISTDATSNVTIDSKNKTIIFETLAAPDLTGCDFTATEDDTNRALKLNVTGVAGQSIIWTVSVDIVQVIS